MTPSRRIFLSGAAASMAFGALPAASVSAPIGKDDLSHEIVATFDRLPGKKALKFWAPASNGLEEWSAVLNPDTALFCGSAFKAFVLAEFLRQIDSDKETLERKLKEPLVLDEEVYSPVSPVFNPPNLSGKVTTRTVLEAMIVHSDNTATDMMLRRVGADKVRQFVASIGLRSVRIPTSTRQFMAYISGSPDWRGLSWSKLSALMNQEKDPYPQRPIVNDIETMVGSPNDFVLFYMRALQGEFFKQKATLDVFRTILSLSGANSGVMPLGVSAFTKGGSIDFAPDYVFCLTGALWIPKRWVYFNITVHAADSNLLPKFVNAAKTIFKLVADNLKS